MKYTTCTFFILICSLISHGQIQTITSIAGNGSSTFSGDGGPATAAGLSEVGMCRDAAGNFYISDSTNARVRKISSSGIITTVAGNGTHGYSGDGGPATNASLYPVIPSGLAIDATGNLYIADNYNGRIRKVNTSGIISTIVGGGTGYTDGIPATSFALYGANGVCIDPVGNIYVSSGLQVMKVTTSGLIYTFAGDGISGYSGDGGQATAARLAGAYGLSMDASGNIYIADAGNYCIRKVNSSGVITTFAGNGTWGYSGDGGPATAAQMNMPYAIAFDGSSNSYIANSTLIRKVNSAGIISTIAGGGGSFADGVAATATNMAPIDVCTDPSSNIYLCDLWNHRIRKICGTLLSSGTIHGDSVLCSGATLTLTDSVSGGVWSSSDTTVATITSGGIVIADTVLSATTVTIKYTVSNACGSVYSTKHVTVNPIPAAGYLSFVPTASYPSIALCVGNTAEIWPSITAGTLSSSDTSVAKIDSVFSHPYLTAYNAGTTNVSYTVTNSYGCSSIITYSVTSLANPSVAPVTGASSLCIGDTITLSDATTDGLWQSSDSLIANIGSHTGIIYGVSLGTTTVSYIVRDTFGCRTTDTIIENVNCDLGIKAIQNSGIFLNLIPNPLSENGRIEFTLPRDINHAEIDIYTVDGKKIKSYPIDHTFAYITVDNSDFPPGMYFYNLSADGVYSPTKKMLIIK